MRVLPIILMSTYWSEQVRCRGGSAGEDSAPPAEIRGGGSTRPRHMTTATALACLLLRPIPSSGRFRMFGHATFENLKVIISNSSPHRNIRRCGASLMTIPSGITCNILQQNKQIHFGFYGFAVVRIYMYGTVRYVQYVQYVQYAVCTVCTV